MVFELFQWVDIEKYVIHDLQKYRMDFPLFVFLITDAVEIHFGHLYFFSYTPSNHTLVY